MMPDTIPEVTPPGGVGAQLKQLIPMLPALLASAKGNPEAMSAFMEGYQRSMAQLQASGQSAARLGMDQADQQQRMTRQAEQDRIAAEDRQRRMAMERVQIAPTLAQMGASADTPQGAESSIDAAFAQIADAFGGREQLGGMRDAAIHMATQTITGRQRADVEKFLAKWENSDRKPEIEAAGADPSRIPVQLPEHIAKHLGKPEATLGELQQFARLPIGVPQGKTRTPAASGSFEEYSDPSTPAERKAQIEADRKRYMQSDDRPRVDVNVNNGLNANQSALLTERLAKSWTDANSSGREMRRQLNLMETGLKRFRAGDKNGGSQAVLVTFQKILDPTSVVRESEYARSAEGISLLGRIEGYADKLGRGGAGVPDDELAAMVETARQMLAGMDGYAKTQRSRIDAMSKEYGIKPELIFGLEAPADSGGGAPMRKPIPGIRGGMAESTDGGKTWKRVQ